MKYLKEGIFIDTYRSIDIIIRRSDSPNDWPCLLKNIIDQLVGSFLTKITQNSQNKFFI
jgi:hypothetical protein